MDSGYTPDQFEQLALELAQEGKRGPGQLGHAPGAQDHGVDRAVPFQVAAGGNPDQPALAFRIRPRGDGHAQRLGLAPHQEGDGLAGGSLDGLGELVPALDRPAVDGQDAVAQLQPGRLGR